MMHKQLLSFGFALGIVGCGESTRFMHQSDTKRLQSGDAVHSDSSVAEDESAFEEALPEGSPGQPDDTKHSEPGPSNKLDERIIAEVPVIISGSFLACRMDQSDESGLTYICNYGIEQKPFIDLTIENNVIVSGNLDHKDALLILTNPKWNESTGQGTVLIRKKLTESKIEPPTPPGTGEETDKKEDKESDLAPVDLNQLIIDPDSADLIKNGSFENQVVNRPGFINDFYTELDFWSLSNGNAIEVQRNDQLPDGEKQWLELCARADTGIIQDLTLVPGTSYELSFAFSPKGRVARNHIRVTLGSDMVLFEKDVDGTGLTGMNWKIYTKRFTPVEETTTIDFRSVNCDGSAGNYLDKVSILKLKAAEK